MKEHGVPDVMQERRRLGDSGGRLALYCLAGGAAAVLVAIATAALGAGWQRFFFSYLLAYAFLLSVGLGALFYVILQHLTRAGWSVVVRRLAEALTLLVPIAVPLFIPILVGMHDLYPWTHGEHVAADHVLQAKQGYLNVPFFVVRWLVYLGAWTWLAAFFFRRSRAQDASGDPAISLQLQRSTRTGTRRSSASTTSRAGWLASSQS
jgi:hypothetical protein